jgi:hypothetical protein
MGAAQLAFSELLQWTVAARIPGELWAECHPRGLPQAPGARRFAEGLADVLIEARHTAPDAHLLYKTHASDEAQEGGLLDHQGNVNVAGVAFAICADLLREAAPAGDVSSDTCRGYLFTCPQGTLAALWPQPPGTATTVTLDAKGPVEHYGACRRYEDLPAGRQDVELKPGASLLRGRFELTSPPPTPRTTPP